MKALIPTGVSAEAEEIKYERCSSPDSFTDRSFTQSSGTMTPNTAVHSDGLLLFDADFPDEKRQGLSADEALGFKHYRDHSSTHIDEKRCSILPQLLAIWRIQGTNVKLSALAAAVLINEQKINVKNLEV